MKKIYVAGIAAVLIVIISVAYYLYVTQPSPAIPEKLSLVVGIPKEPNTLDPANAIGQNTGDVLCNIYDTLVYYQYGTLDIVPRLAESWETEDSQTYVFNLKKGVKFHDGTPFNASCVKYSIDRVFEAGVADFQIAVLNRTDVLDEYSVKFTLDQPHAGFVSMLAGYPISIVSPTAVEKYGDDFTKNPVGTGAFKFVSWVLGSEIVLTKNEEYFRGESSIDEIIYRILPEASTRRMELETGAIDITYDLMPTDLDELKTKPSIHLVNTTGVRTEYLGFNCGAEPFNKTLLRKAIAYSIDYKSIVDNIMRGYAERAHSPIPPKMWGHNPDVPKYSRNLTLAQELLSDAGFSEGFTTTLSYDADDSMMVTIATVVQSNLADVGIGVELNPMEWSSFLYYCVEGNQELFLLGWTPDWMDPDNLLYSMHHSSNIYPNGYSNFEYFSYEHIDQMLEEEQTELDEQQRIEVVRDLQYEIMVLLPRTYLFIRTITVPISDNIIGFKPSPLGLNEFFYLDKSNGS
jgi:peptide/nickel transport system substrate-binding protein